MKLDLAILCYTVPGLQWIGNFITPSQLFHISQSSATLSMRFYPHTHRFLQPLRQLLAASEVPYDAEEISRRYLTFRRYMNYLEKAWRHENICNRIDLEIRGQDHLDAALQSGRGAILLSGHAYGFNRLVGPLLSRRGYTMIRPGMVRPEELDGLQSDNTGDWTYVYLEKDRWQRLRALKALARALNRNAIAHILVNGQPEGDPRLSLQFCGQPLYLSSAVIDLVALMNRPTLPCFALCDSNGKLIIEIQRALPPDWTGLVLEFTKAFESHLRDAPEFVRFWRRFAKRLRYF
jgi:lauroyl/myristoyl acyltransferase